MPRSLSLVVAVFFSLLVQSPGQFDFGKGLEGAKDSATAALVSEVTAIAPGKPFTVAFQLAIPPEWHAYYLNSGGVEKSPTLTWTLPEGFTAGPIQWPVPEVKEIYGSKSFVYGGMTIFLVEITPPVDLKSGDAVKLGAKATWQICSDQCRDEKAELTLDLKAAGTSAVDPVKAPLFAKARAALPKVSSAWTLAVESAADSVKIRMTPGKGAANNLEAAGLQFIPASLFVKTSSEGGSVAKDGNDWVVTVKRATEDALGNKITPGKTLSGIFSAKSPLDTTLGANAILLSDVAVTTPPPPPPAPLSLAKLLPILGGMLLGGLILNLMPCVFPVLAMKAAAFARLAGHERREMRRDGLAYTAGVLVSFGAMAAVVVAIRASVGDVTWGFQFQSPVFSLLVAYL
ncbi:MAG: protein-disulfide reductase DsbD domain-containing protein, partial [Verrucomicrobiales bacterium]